MADLLEQAAQLPHFEYTPPNHRKAARKNDHNARDFCPKCGELKLEVSSLCYQCAFSVCRAPVDMATYWIDGLPCRKVPLNRRVYATVDAEDYDRIMRWRWTAPLPKDKAKAHVVTSHCLDQSIRPLRYITLPIQHVVMQCPHTILLDHRNRDSLDNRKSNIRPADVFRNAQNKDRFQSNKSGYKGVWKCTHSDTYQTCINAFGQKINIGNFRDARAAAMARDIATFAYHGEFGVFNFPELIEQIREKAQSQRQMLMSKLTCHADPQ